MEKPLVILIATLACAMQGPAQTRGAADLMRDVRGRDFDRASRGLEAAAQLDDGLPVIVEALSSRSPHIRIEASHALTNRMTDRDAAIAALAEHLAEHRPIFGDMYLWADPRSLKDEAEVAARRAASARTPDPARRKASEFEDPERTARVLAIHDFAQLCEGRPGRYEVAMGGFAAPDALHVTARSDVRLGWGMVVMEMGDEGHAPILAALASPSISSQACALAALELLGDKAAEVRAPLVSLVGSSNAAIRFRALRALSAAKLDPGAQRALVAPRLEDAALPVRLQALRELLPGSSDDPDAAIPIVEEGLASKDPVILLLATACVAVMEHTADSEIRKLVPGLIRVLRHDREQLRGQAVITIYKLGPVAVKARNALNKIAKDKKERQNMRDGARRALESLNG